MSLGQEHSYNESCSLSDLGQTCFPPWASFPCVQQKLWKVSYGLLFTMNALGGTSPSGPLQEEKEFHGRRHGIYKFSRRKKL